LATVLRDPKNAGEDEKNYPWSKKGIEFERKKSVQRKISFPAGKIVPPPRGDWGGSLLKRGGKDLSRSLSKWEEKGASRRESERGKRKSSSFRKGSAWDLCAKTPYLFGGGKGEDQT